MIEYVVRPISCDSVIRAYVTSHHYTNTCPTTTKQAFGLFDGERMLGVLLLGGFSRLEAAKKYAGCLELTRMFVEDGTPKNTESFFIGSILRWMRSNSEVKGVVSYADPSAGHTGVIYKASNFHQIGITKQSYHYVNSDGVRVHKRQVWNRAISNHQTEREQAAAEGLTKVMEPGKPIFGYALRGTMEKILSEASSMSLDVEVQTKTYLYKRTGKWLAVALVDGKQLHIGYFSSEEAAILAGEGYIEKQFKTHRRSAEAVECVPSEFPNDYDPVLHASVQIAGRQFYIDRDDLQMVLICRWCLDTRYLTMSRRSRDERGCESGVFHRLIMRAPEGYFVDHINGMKNDNRRVNLRVVHPALNNHNREFVGTSGYRGVVARKGGWYEAWGSWDYERKLLGRTKDILEAARLYDRSVVEFFGRDAITNFPLSDYVVPDRAKVLDLPATGRRAEAKKVLCPECCKRQIVTSRDRCSRCESKFRRREVAERDGREVVKYADRVGKKSEKCTHPGCDRADVFARNMCEPHWRAARKAEGVKKPRRPHAKCSVQDCQKIVSDGGMCRSHFNKAHGIVRKRTGRPKAERVPCKKPNCPREATVTNPEGLCIECYQDWYYEQHPEKWGVKPEGVRTRRKS